MGRVCTIHLHCGTPQHTLYPAKGPVLPRGPGRSPGRKFWPLQRHFNAENHVTMTYSTLLESSRRDLRDSGHTRGCEMGQKDGPGRAGTGRAGARARAPRRMRGARAGRGRGAPWARGLDGHKPVQPARRSTAPGSSPAHSSSAASQLPSERRPGALPPTGAESSGCEQAGTVNIASGAQARRAVRAGAANAEQGRALGAGRVGARASAPWSLGRTIDLRGGCAPARPACAAARARTPTLPVPRATSGHPLPHSITTHSLCVPGIVQVSTRAFERGAVRLLGACFLLRNAFKKPKFSSGAPPRTP